MLIAYYWLLKQALDKIRFLSLTNKEILGEGDNTKLEILVRRVTKLMLFCSILSEFQLAYNVIFAVCRLSWIRRRRSFPFVTEVLVWQKKISLRTWGPLPNLELQVQLCFLLLLATPMIPSYTQSICSDVFLFLVTYSICGKDADRGWPQSHRAVWCWVLLSLLGRWLCWSS